MAFKIGTFNVLNKNKKPGQISQFMADTGVDVVAFQELTPNHIRELARLGYAMTHTSLSAPRRMATARAGHSVRRLWGLVGPRWFRMAVVSRYPLRSHKVYKHPKPGHKGLMARLFGWRECVESLSVVVESPYGAINIINVHSSFSASVEDRAHERDQAYKAHARTDMPNVMLGDFNSVGGTPLAYLFFWLIGIPFRQRRIDENAQVEKFARAHGLQKVFSGARSYPRFSIQLDQILLPDAWPVHDRTVIRKGYGSDHRALVVDTTPQA